MRTRSPEETNRTPSAFQHVNLNLPPKLTDLMAPAPIRSAIPMMGQAPGRSGSGIWLHGTGRHLFPPTQASDGCVVLANPDLYAVAKNLRWG